jgi:hypothetical protein
MYVGLAIDTLNPEKRGNVHLSAAVGSEFPRRRLIQCLLS